MEIIRKLFVIIVLFLFVISCFHQERQLKSENGTSVKIQLNPSEAVNDSIALSYIAERVEYIPLQKTDSAILGYFYDFKVTKDFIFVREQNSILEFSKEGRFIRQMFNVGSGPGESIAKNFAVNESDKLMYAYDIHSRKGNIYDFNGTFINALYKDLSDPSYWINSIDYFQSNIFVSISPRPGTGYIFSCFDLRNDSVRVLYKNNNAFTFSQEKQNPMIVLGNNGYQVTQSHLLIKDRYCDTVFLVDKDFKTEPLYVIGLGNAKMTWEDFRDHGMFNIADGPPGGYWIESFVDTKSFLFLMIKSFRNPELLCVYNKRTGAKIVTSNKDYKTQDQQVFMKNDLDHLVAFPPMSKRAGLFFYYDECLYSVIEAKDFADAYNSASVEIKTSSDYLRKMAPVFSKIDEFSNPVIMKVFLK
ncbi:MAG: 6-bladed beta-propeller [Bacteroidales bacterium]|nr:6-bladed beta-propeller [Bacteroidales bacterium]